MTFAGVRIGDEAFALAEKFRDEYNTLRFKAAKAGDYDLAERMGAVVAACQELADALEDDRVPEWAWEAMEP